MSDVRLRRGLLASIADLGTTIEIWAERGNDDLKSFIRKVRGRKPMAQDARRRPVLFPAKSATRLKA